MYKLNIIDKKWIWQISDELIYTETINPVIKVNNIKISKLEEITNKVFEGILQEKSDGEAFKPTRSEKGSVKVSKKKCVKRVQHNI